jgi:hypothetical protein
MQAKWFCLAQAQNLQLSAMTHLQFIWRSNLKRHFCIAGVGFANLSDGPMGGRYLALDLRRAKC